MMIIRSQATSLDSEDFMMVDTSEVEQAMYEEPDLLNGRSPQVKPLLPAGSGSSGSSSSSSYYTANTSFSTSSSSSSSSSSLSSLYFTPNASFEEEKPGAHLLKDGITRHILSIETPKMITRKQEIKLEQTADRELEAILKERDLVYGAEQQGFHMDVDSESESLGDYDDIWVSSVRDSASIANACGDTDSTEATDAVAPLASSSKKIRSLARSDTEIIEPSMSFRTASTPVDIGNWRHPQPSRRQHTERWNV
ncbi:hypothetical protein C0992_004509 [Termitomyces sp. T32_za158]|nr:hypothetical protein C0992_004509 [Termitomyces sp. T32_za158]